MKTIGRTSRSIGLKGWIYTAKFYPGIFRRKLAIGCFPVRIPVKLPCSKLALKLFQRVYPAAQALARHPRLILSTY
jgi:hypothetical protein